MSSHIIEFIRETRQDISRSIFVGERYDRNLRGIAVVSILIAVVSIFTGCMNIAIGHYEVAATAPVEIISGLLGLYFAVFRKNRKAAITILMTDIIVVYTYDAFFAANGFAIYWTIIFPLAFYYFAGVRAGLIMSTYFLLLYMILFSAPVRHIVEGHYSEIIMDRFPILYFVDVVLTTYIMVQYHKSTLHQMDYEQQLLTAKESAEQAEEAATRAKEAADQANKAKSIFLADMSHEIRTPINAVLGMNEMVLRESRKSRDLAIPDGEAVQAAFETISTCAGNIESAGNNLLAIINDILDFSKIEAGKMEIVDRDYQLGSVLNDVSNMIYFRAKEKGLDFVVEVDETLPDGLCGDEVRVRQVITNVLNNAVKYTEQGKVYLSVGSGSQEKPEPGKMILLTIAVRDTGIGIKPEDIEKLFMKFQRVDMSRNSTIEGTGLGLAITRKLLDLMGGTIQVESVYGTGSTFTIKIPQKVVSEEPVGNFKTKFEESMLAAKAYEESFTAPDAHILIVDDTKMNLMVAAGLLKNTKIRIDTALSGKKALELTGAYSFDLILMDQRMPEMDGTETLHRIRVQEEGRCQDTPVVCLTADAVIGAKQRYIADGFTDYLTKPVDSTALEKMLLQYLPADKVRIQQKKAASDSADDKSSSAAADTPYAPLAKAGIDPDTGLRYCQNEDAFYQSLLLEYARGTDEKLRSMQAFYETRDWDNYAVLVHALKSSSKMIGATLLSEIAARVEAAANTGNEEKIRLEHDNMAGQYKQVSDAILSTLTVSDSDPAAVSEDDDILEFFPE